MVVVNELKSVSFVGRKENEDAKKAPFIDFLLNASYKLHLIPIFIFTHKAKLSLPKLVTIRGESLL